MKKEKINLADVKGKLSREEMKKIMGGSAPVDGRGCMLQLCSNDSACCPENPKCSAGGTTSWCV